jgi:hypothetical protein
MAKTCRYTRYILHPSGNDNHPSKTHAAESIIDTNVKKEQQCTKKNSEDEG